MARVTGIGGVFFKARDAEALRAWYRRHLGLDIQSWGGVTFQWRDGQTRGQDGATVWTIFPADTKYFSPSSAPFMVNYRVANLAQVLVELRAEGCAVDDKTEESEFGKFGWVMDPEGNRIRALGAPGRTTRLIRHASSFLGLSRGPTSGTQLACSRSLQLKAVRSRRWLVATGPNLSVLQRPPPPASCLLPPPSRLPKPLLL